jgi:hypothetical protein
MSTGHNYINERAAQAAAERLQQAAAFTRLHIKNPCFQKRMGDVLVRFEWPGVLMVADPNTGAVLAQSAPGEPETLAMAAKPFGHP